MDDNSLRKYLIDNQVLGFDQVDSTIRRQTLLKGQGEFVSWGELLVEEHHLTRDQLTSAWSKIEEQLEEERSREDEISLTDAFDLAAEEREENIPDELGNYEVLGKVGQGGMGVIYQARQKDLNRVVALKVLRPDLGDNPEQLHRFKREAEAVAKLKHPNIISIFEIGYHQSIPFFSMDFVEGSSMEDWLGQDNPNPIQGLEFMEAIARALGYAHSRGVIHRDIKPSNILIGHDQVPKLTDFGLAKNLDSHSLITHTGEIVGTVSYMSPEQALGQSRDMDGRSDIYSLGIILYEICAGRLPFQGETTVEILRKIAEDDPLSLRKYDQHIHWEIETIIFKALEKDPNLRYQHAEELADDIRRFLEGEAIQAKPLTFVGRLRRKVEKYKTMVTAISIALIVIVGLLVERYLNYLQIKENRRAARQNLIHSRQEAFAFEALMLLDREQPQKALHNLNQALKLSESNPRLLYLRGQAYQMLGRGKLAVEDFTTALEKKGKFVEALFKRAETYRQLSRYNEALEDYTRFIELNPQFVHVYASRGEVFLQQKLYREAVQDLDRAIKANPKYGANYILRGRAYMGWNKYGRARDNFEKALELGAKSPDIPLYLGQCLTELGEYQRALEVYSRARTSTSPSHQKRAHLLLARLLKGQHRYWDAIENADYLLKDNEKHVAARRLKASCLFLLGELERARQEYEKLVPLAEGLRPRDQLELARLRWYTNRPRMALQLLQTLQYTQARTLEGLIYYENKSYGKVENLAHQTITKDRFYGDGYALLALVDMARKKYYGAVKNFTLALEKKSELPFIYSRRGQCYLQLSALEKARRDFHQSDVIGLKAGTQWARFFQMGVEAERNLQPGRACKLYRYAAFLNPGFARVHYRMGSCLMRSWAGGKVPATSVRQSRIELEKAVESDPFMLEAYPRLAEVYLREKKYSQVREIIGQATRLGGRDGDLYYYMGRAFLEEKKWGPARIAFLKAVKMEEDHFMSYGYLARIAEKENRKDLAKKYMEKFNQYRSRAVRELAQVFQMAAGDLNREDFARCIERCTAIIEKYPRSARAYIMRGQARLFQIFRRAPSLSQRAPEALWARRQDFVRVILQIGLDFARAVEIQPRRMHVFLGHYGQVVKSLFHLLPRREGLRLVQGLLEDFPSGAEVYFIRGMIYFFLHEMGLVRPSELVAGAGHLREALKIKPGFAAARSVLGYFYLVRDREKEAVEAFEKVAQKAPALSVNYYFMACLYSRQKKIATAIAQLHRALDYKFSHYERLLTQPMLEAVRNSPDWKVIRRRW